MMKCWNYIIALEIKEEMQDNATRKLLDQEIKKLNNEVWEVYFQLEKKTRY